MTTELDILITLKTNQKKAIKSYTFFAILVICVGILLIIISLFFIEHSETLKLFIGIGGGFISTVSAFPIKEIIIRIERMRIYDFVEKNRNNMTSSELKKIEEMVWKSVEKII